MADLIDRLVTTDPESGQRMVETVHGGTWASLFAYILSPRGVHRFRQQAELFDWPFRHGGAGMGSGWELAPESGPAFCYCRQRARWHFRWQSD